MISAFKSILGHILEHNFRNTEFFLSKQEIRDDTTTATTSRMVNKLSVSDSSSQSFEGMKEKIDLKELLKNYHVIDVSTIDKDLSNNLFFDPQNHFDIYGYAIMNLIVGSLLSVHTSQLRSQGKEEY